MLFAGDVASRSGVLGGANQNYHRPSSWDRIVLLEVLDLYWRLPESGGWWYTSRQLKKTIWCFFAGDVESRSGVLGGAQPLRPSACQVCPPLEILYYMGYLAHEKTPNPL